MVLCNFNAFHPSWLSRIGDDREAARREVLDEVINSSRLEVTNLNLPTRLPSQDQPSSSDITLPNGNLLPDVTWSTLTTLGSDYLPRTIFLFSHASPSPRKVPQGWLGGIHSRVRESSCVVSATPEEIIYLVVMLEITAALSRNLYDSSSRREISATLTTLPSSCWTGTSSVTFAKEHKTSGGPSWLFQPRHQYKALPVFST